MFKPTEVNFINESDQRITIKQRTGKEGKVTLLPGEQARIQDSLYFQKDLDVDIIVNPLGKENDSRLGSFAFDNPGGGYPAVSSPDFKWFGWDTSSSFGYTNTTYGYHGTYSQFAKRPETQKWGRLPDGYRPIRRGDNILSQETIPDAIAEAATAAIRRTRPQNNNKSSISEYHVYQFQGFAPAPTFEIESFSDSFSEKRWDLHIQTVPGDLG